MINLEKEESGSKSAPAAGNPQATDVARSPSDGATAPLSKNAQKREKRLLAHLQKREERARESKFRSNNDSLLDGLHESINFK